MKASGETSPGGATTWALTTDGVNAVSVATPAPPISLNSHDMVTTFLSGAGKEDVMIFIFAREPTWSPNALSAPGSRYP